MTSKKVEVDKINVEELLQVFKDINQDAFILYLKSIWKDLAQRSENKDKGINKITFIQYYILPGIISDRLFAVFDEDKNGFLSLQEFYDGMMTLFTKPFEELSFFIFRMYDSDSDGEINKNDIKTLMQYINIDSSILNHVNQISSSINYQDRIESQKELNDKLESIFGNQKSIDYKKFKAIIEEKNSDIYLFLLIFIMENRPFKNKTIEFYINCLSKSGISKSPTQQNTVKLIASPSTSSRFSPSQFLSNSPCIKQKKMKKEKENGLNLLEKYTEKKKSKKDMIKLLTGEEAPTKQQTDLSSIGPIRKNVAFLKNLEKDNMTKTKKDHDENDPMYSLHEARKYEGTNIIKSNNENVIKEEDDETHEILQFEGYIYKITESNKLKKLWFKLYDKDLFYYKNKDETVHKGMHHLSGIYIKEDKPTVIEEKSYYTFKMVYPQKDRDYYVEDKEDYKKWVSYLSKAVGFYDLNLKYEIGPKLGNGKFGLVKLATNKKTGLRLAAKFMSKKEMTNVDLELVRTEIEILKVCQHPNIIRIYDVFENMDSFYICKYIS